MQHTSEEALFHVLVTISNTSKAVHFSSSTLLLPSPLRKGASNTESISLSRGSILAEDPVEFTTRGAWYDNVCDSNFNDGLPLEEDPSVWIEGGRR
jgi:hypothetical protein